MGQNFLPEHRISIAIAAGSRTAGQTAINGAMVDMQGYEGVVAVVEMGTIAATAVTSIKWQQSDTTDFSDLEGTGIDIADDGDNEIFVSELYKPTKRYVRVVVDRGTANAALRAATYIQYKARTAPVTQGTGVNSELNVGPAEGTA